MSPFSQTPHPPLPPPLRFTPTSHMPTAMGASLSVTVPHGPGKTPGPVPCGGGGNHPCLRTKDNQRLNYGFEEKSGHLRPCHLPDKDPSHTPPHHTRLLQIMYHRQPIIIYRWNHSPQVYEVGHHLKGAPISDERPWGYRPFLLFHQTTLLPLHPLLSHISCIFPSSSSFPGSNPDTVHFTYASLGTWFKSQYRIIFYLDLDYYR